MKFLDIFSGIGGFRIGMEMAGHECAGFCEFDVFAKMSYTMMHLATEEQRKYIESIPTPLKKNGEKNFTKRKRELLGKGSEEYRNGEWYANDIRTVHAGNIPRADIWCFGAPCQDFSIAGSRKGLDGDRSSLVREVFRIVGELKEEDRPQYLIYENVKGMLSSNKGWDFASILVEMEAHGYDIEYQLLNSKNFGVPQNRERVFIIGHFRGRGGRKVFPIGENDKETNIKVIGHSGSGGQKGYIHDINGIVGALSATDYKQPKQIMQIGNCMPTKTRDNPNQGRIYAPQSISPCLNKMDGGGREPMVAIPVLTPDRAEKRQNGRRFKEDGEPMFTLTAQDRHGVAILRPVRTEYGKQIRKDYEAGNLEISRHEFMKLEPREDGISNTLSTVQKDNLLINNTDFRIRRLTPRECFRLQGVSDEYFDRAAAVNSDSQLYKQAGNMVTVNVIYEIGKRL